MLVLASMISNNVEHSCFNMHDLKRGMLRNGSLSPTVRPETLCRAVHVKAFLDPCAGSRTVARRMSKRGRVVVFVMGHFFLCSSQPVSAMMVGSRLCVAYRQSCCVMLVCWL